MTTSAEPPSELARTIDRLGAANQSLGDELDDARGQIVELAAERAILGQRLEDQRRELHATRLELAAAHQTLAAASARLAVVATQLAGVLGSRSWTLTAPVRRVLGRPR